MTLILMLIMLGVLLVFSAFFSGSETALFSLTRHQRTQLARSDSLAGHTITTLLSETRSLLITLLLGNMTVNVLFFVISSVLLLRVSRAPWAGPTVATLASVIPLLTIILVGEVLPKLVAARLTVTWAKVIAVPLLLFHRLISPVRLVSSALIITPLARLIAPPTKPTALSGEELESLLELSQKQGVIEPEEEDLLQQVLELNQLKVRDLMVPRVDIQAFDLAQDPAALIDFIRQTRLRHIPVYEGDLDNIIGQIHARQALLKKPASTDELRKLIRQIKFVPEQQRADQLLVDLRKTGTKLAIVVDEYGGTAGLITIEDVVEHMVGDIAGQFEAGGEPEIEQVRPGVWRVDGQLPIHDWADFFGRNRALQGLAAWEAVSTVAGLIMAQLGRVPQVGDRTSLGNVIITVEKMDGSRIESVLIELQPKQPAQGEATS